MPEHWTDDFENAAITTDEQRADFKQAMSKFPTVDDAAVGYVELQKTAGAPFKLPKLLENLPDDASRADFTSQTRALLGIVHAGSVEDLGDLDMGVNEGQTMDEALAAKFKSWVVSEKIPKAVAQKVLGFHKDVQAVARKAYADESATAKKACNDALASHTDFGSQEKLDAQTLLLHRALLNNSGLSAEEAEDISEFLKSREGSTNPALRRVLLNRLAPLAAETSNEGPGGPSTSKTPEVHPDDGCPSEFAAGLCTKEQNEAWKKRTGSM